MKRRLLIAALLLSLTAAAAGSGDVITVTGRQHLYEIPRHLQKNFSSILYPGKIEDDDTGNEALLLISDRDFPKIALEKPWEVTILLFWDRDYGTNGGIVSVSKRMVQNADPAGRIGAFHHYRNPLGTMNRDYYLSFDPSEVSSGGPGHYYYVKTIDDGPLEVGDIKIESKIGCSLYSVQDGISVQLSTNGSLCSVNHFDSLYAALSELMQRWRR